MVFSLSFVEQKEANELFISFFQNYSFFGVSVSHKRKPNVFGGFLGVELTSFKYSYSV